MLGIEGRDLAIGRLLNTGNNNAGTTQILPRFNNNNIQHSGKYQYQLLDKLKTATASQDMSKIGQKVGIKVWSPISTLIWWDYFGMSLW